MGQKDKRWTIHILHHSHTDIGYTDRQEKIERYHIQFIKQAIEISEAATNGSRLEWQDFHWICETFWAVEQFLLQEGPEWRERLIAAIRRGTIELTGNYLNFTELLDGHLLASSLAKAPRFAEEVDVQIKSAMTADINGYAWGYAQGLLNVGVENLFSCVHTHHGMFPLGRKQIPFWWEAPGGGKLLVWNGEHYNLGNELGLVPPPTAHRRGGVAVEEEQAEQGQRQEREREASSGREANPEDHAKQERRPEQKQEHECEQEQAALAAEHLAWMEKRIFPYLETLAEENYPYDLVPVMLSGLFVDNAPPNAAILDLIRAWNTRHGDRVFLQMSTLQGFFDAVREADVELPVYRGDWPDWWSDGPSSTAAATQLYRDAARTLRKVRALVARSTVRSATAERLLAEAEYPLQMYAEHTWGYSSSVGEPWELQVQALGARKAGYATEGHRLAYAALDEVLAQAGEVPLAAHTDLCYAVMNPEPHYKAGIAALHVHYWQMPLLKAGFKVRNRGTGEELPFQLQQVARGNVLNVPYALAAGEQAIYEIIPTPDHKPDTVITNSFLLIGADRVVDSAMVEPEPLYPVHVDATGIRSPYVHISWRLGDGICSWVDRTTGEELLRPDREHQAFTPVYEVTPVAERKRMLEVRREMGRNRKGKDVQRYAGRLQSVRTVEKGELLATAELLYEVEGTAFFSLFLTVYANDPRVDVKVRMLKESVWEPENVYLSLPFRNGEAASELWVEKTGCALRPWIDQLPGTGTDFYCIQEGFALVGGNTSLSVGIADTPLLQVGPLAYGTRKLMGHPQLAVGQQQLYAWVLNNFWETNFKAEVGGFYEFRYAVQRSTASKPAAALAICHSLNTEPVVIKIDR